jgi:hypothetical protein
MFRKQHAQLYPPIVGPSWVALPIHFLDQRQIRQPADLLPLFYGIAPHVDPLQPLHPLEADEAVYAIASEVQGLYVAKHARRGPDARYDVVRQIERLEVVHRGQGCREGFEQVV